MSIPFRPVMPAMAPERVGGLGVLARLRQNALAAFPPRCLIEPVVHLSLPGRGLFLATGGTAIAEVLQSRADAFRRLPAARRILGPIVGEGLLTSQGAAWHRQRLAMAPAFTPRQLPMMAGHIVRASNEAVTLLRARSGGPVDLLAAMQCLSLEVAARSMFSIEADGFREHLHDLVSSYSGSIGRPSIEDFILPGWLPTPLGVRRRLFRRRWLSLIRDVVNTRRNAGEGAARDLFDLLAAAHPGEPDLLVDQVATMIVAGHETTALTLF